MAICKVYEFYTDAHRVTGVRIKPPSHEANIKALLGRETRNLEKNPSLVQLVGLEPVASHTTVECFNHLATHAIEVVVELLEREILP